jgi:hypothetical protein
VPQDGAEAARIIQPQQRLSHEHIEMIMFPGRRRDRQQVQVARHAEMNDQRAVVEFEQQVFAAPAHAAHSLAAHLSGQIGRKWPAQPGGARDNAGHRVALDVGAMPRRVTSTSGNSGMRTVWLAYGHAIKHNTGTKAAQAQKGGQELYRYWPEYFQERSSKLNEAACLTTYSPNQSFCSRSISMVTSNEESSAASIEYGSQGFR